MSEPLDVEVRETWVNGATSPRDRRGTNYYRLGSFVRAQSSSKRIYLRPSLPNLSGLTILDAYLVGHSTGTVAQTLTVWPISEKWQLGRVTWSNQPAVTTSAAVSATVPAAADKAPVTIPGLAPIIQAVADGSPWFGLRLGTSVDTAQVFYASESGEASWELHVVVSDLSQPAVDLRPDGGAVGSARPRLAWFADDQIARRVQVDTPAIGADPDDVAPNYDSGMQTTASQVFDLLSSPHTPAGNGPHYWRVLVERSSVAGTPEWSDWAEWTVSSLPALIVDSPVGALGDPAPTLTAHLASGVLSQWKAMVTGPDRSDIRAESGLQTGPIQWAIPEKSSGRSTLIQDGWINLRARDSVDRAVAVGQPEWSEVWIKVNFADAGGILAPSNLMVRQLTHYHPQHEWVWRRTAPADGWLLQSDGVDLRRLDADEVTQNEAGDYVWLDHGEITPGREHILSVRAIEGTQRSAPVTRRQTHTVHCAWLIPDALDPIQLDEGDASGWGSLEKRATYELLVGQDVDITYDSNPGRTGTFEGLIGEDYERESVWVVKDRLEQLRSPAHRFAQLVWASESIRVRLIDVDVLPAVDYNASNLRHKVTFEFREES